MRLPCFGASRVDVEDTETTADGLQQVRWCYSHLYSVFCEFGLCEDGCVYNRFVLYIVLYFCSFPWFFKDSYLGPHAIHS